MDQEFAVSTSNSACEAAEQATGERAPAAEGISGSRLRSRIRPAGGPGPVGGLVAHLHVFDPIHSAPLEEFAIRWHYYTVLQGDDVKLDSVRDRIHALGFDPHTS